MKKPRAPKGYRLVTRGVLGLDDLRWSSFRMAWFWAGPLAGVDVRHLPAVARKVPRPRKGKGKKGRA